MTSVKSHEPASLTDEDRAFLQRRVALFGLLASCCFLGFLLFRVAMEVAFGNGEESLTHPSVIFHLAAGLSLLAVYALTCRGQHSGRYIRAVETIGLILATVFTLFMGKHIPLWARPDFILVLALTSAMTCRALFVPSSARRTLGLGLAVGVELVALTYFSFLEIDPKQWAVFDPGIASVSPEFMARSVAFNVGAWWLLTTAIATAASRVIYGLRRDIKSAKQLGQYKLDGKLGEGGMGVVFRASHALLRRPTAIKLLLPEKSGAENLARFEREVRLTAKLRHPNTITIFDYGRTPDGIFYYAMEYVAGSNLEELIEKTGPLNPARVAYILAQAAAALVEAHGVELIHRDIKPSNIMVQLPHEYGGVNEMVKLMDFGLVKQVRAESQEVALTQAGSVSGTPQYMSPEAIRDPGSVDGRSDLYALGAVGYYLLTGQHVFDGKTIVDVCSQHLYSVPKPMSDHGVDVPDELEQIIRGCLAKDPSARPQTALDLQRTLEQCQQLGAWTSQQASTWWRENAGPLRARTDSSSPARLLTIDIERLRGASSGTR